jgi:hypothetical protein
VASGYADDGLVEAIEIPAHGHPEEDERSRVVGSLVSEARDRMKAPTQ